MTRMVKRAYIAIIAFLAVLLVYYLAAYRDRLETNESEHSFEILEPYLVSERDDSDENGVTQVIRVKADRIEGSYCTVMFYSIHQNVEVYCDHKLVYGMKAARKNTFTKTPGGMWNIFQLEEGMAGEEIRIELTSVYPFISYKAPEIYFGEQGPIFKSILSDQAFPLISSMLLILIGFFFVGYVLYNFKNSEVDKNLGMLGWFAAQVGSWKFFDLSITKYFFRGLPVISMLPFMALMSVVIPCVFFLMELHSTKDQKTWLIPCWVSLGVCYLTVFLQFFKFLDFRQMFFLIVFSILFALAVVSYMTVVEFKRVGWSGELKKNLLGFVLIALGVLLDLGEYFLSGGRRTTDFAVLGFLLYTIVRGYFTLRESGDLIEAGEGTRSYEDMAYHDKMTGCFNRSAFIVDTDPYAVEPDDYVVAVLDLNNLKKCNDTLGHERGDRYIKDSAKIILGTFGKLGSCYRMGGDEFYCLIPKGGLSACKEQKAIMDKMVEEYNAKSTDIRMGIACGYARYDKRMDYDLNATAKRADALMYKNKQAMKSSQSQ